MELKKEYLLRKGFDKGGQASENNPDSNKYR
jgi:hypothetical protein